jgi:hypothetical protein
MATKRSARFGDWAGSLQGAVVVSVLGIGLLLGGRIAIGAVLGDAVHPTTYLGIVGGALGSGAMLLAWWQLGMRDPAPAAQFWSGVLGDPWGGDGDASWLPLHVVYGALLGGLYPRMLWLAIGGRVWPSLPGGLVSGAVFGGVVCVLAVGYGALGWFGWVGTYTGEVTVMSHLAYGVVLGFVVGVNGLL